MLTTTTFMEWLDAESDTFSMLCGTEPGEKFTHKDVLVMHLYIAFLAIVVLIVGVLA